MNKTYTVVMREDGVTVAEREYTNKDAAIEMGVWYLIQRLNQSTKNQDYIRYAIRRFRETLDHGFICKIVER